MSHQIVSVVNPSLQRPCDVQTAATSCPEPGHRTECALSAPLRASLRVDQFGKVVHRTYSRHPRIFLETILSSEDLQRAREEVTAGGQEVQQPEGWLLLVDRYRANAAVRCVAGGCLRLTAKDIVISECFIPALDQAVSSLPCRASVRCRGHVELHGIHSELAVNSYLSGAAAVPYRACNTFLEFGLSSSPQQDPEVATTASTTDARVPVAQRWRWNPRRRTAL